jgi:hypothetical protein
VTVTDARHAEFTLPKTEIFSPILEIESKNGLWLDHEKARAAGERLHAKHANAEPFPHSLMDNFLPEEIARHLVEDFPNEPLPRDKVFDAGYGGFHKRLIQPSDCSPFVREFFAFMNSEPVLQFLEGVTGIKGLISDPYYYGGGFHETKRGGLLGVHADFRVQEDLFLQRRLNLIIYLNKDWEESWGGQLGLWDRDVKTEVQTVYPFYNRGVVFNTDAHSFHGHPDPLACPDNRSRRSVALYYYTASPAILEEVRADSTIYIPRGSDSFARKYEAWSARSYSLLKEWLPPVLFRQVREIKRSLSKD